MDKLNPIKYIENMLSHHPKSIFLWITEGIVIDGKRYIIKEFRLRDGKLFAVIAEDKYKPKYFEVQLCPDEETLKEIYKAIEENKIAIEKEVTDRKNEINRVDSAIKANTTKINQEITDRKNEINRVDKKIEANTAKINKEITDRQNDISRVNEAISANTAKINKEITDRQNEITRVDNAINANTAKIDKEIQDRTNEITRVDGAINANTEKINQEITDRTNEINRVDNKITALEDKSTTTDSQIAALDKATKDNKAKIDQEITNRRDEINRVDEKIEANTTKINQEITDRQNEISRVDRAINANTAKINKEIKDRKDEITRVEGKIPTEIGGTNHYAISKDSKTGISSHFSDVKRDVTTGIISAKITGVYPYFGQAVGVGGTYKETNGQKIPVIQGKSIAVTFSNSLFNKSYVSYFGSDDVAIKGYRNKDASRFIVPASDLVGVSYITLRYGLANGTAYVGQTVETKVKVEYDSVYTDWSPAPEDIEYLIAQKQDKLTAGTGIAIQDNVISATGSSAPQHDTQKEQVLASTQNTITITHGTNGTSETTKVDTNPAKVLEHTNLLTDYGISKNTTGNTTKLGLEYKRVDGDRFDLNNLINGKVMASDFVNAPKTNTWYFVSSFTENLYTIQEAVTLVDTKNTTYRRTKQNGSWGAWREQVGDKSVIDSAISANTTKINQEITDRKNEITRVEGKIPTSVSTRNLILKSNDFANPHKQNGANTTVTSTDDYFVIRSTGYTDNAYGGMSWNMSISEVKAGEQFSILMPVYIDSSVTLDNGWSFNIKNHKLNTLAYDYSIPTNKKDQWFNVAITFKAFNNVVFDTYPFYVYLTKNGLVRIKPPMLVRGNLIPSDYQPAFEDIDINADGVVMKAGKTTTDIANAIGSYFAVNQNAINKFSDKINVKTAMIADGAVTSAKIAREITLDTLTCGKLNSTNGVTAFDLNTGTLKFTNNSGRIQRSYRDKVIEITDYITSTSGAQDYATSAFVVRKSDNSKQAAVKLTLDNTKAEATITSDLFHISDSNSKMLFSVDRTNNVVSDWGDIPIAHVLGGLVANDISIGGRSKSLLKIVDELCKKAGITWF